MQCKAWGSIESMPIGSTILAVSLCVAAPSVARAQSAPDLNATLQSIAARSPGRVGAAVAIVGSGAPVFVAADAHFPMQSVYKFPIGMAVLAEVDRGRLSLDQVVTVESSEYISKGQHSPLRDANPGGARLPLREILRLAVSESDGTASDVLLRLLGGPARVMTYLKTLGVEGITVADTEMAIGRDNAVQYRNWATPRGALALLRAFAEKKGLSPASWTVLRTLMVETGTGPHRLKGALPAGTVVAHKTGASGTVDGVTAATNDVGLIALPDGRQLAVAVFVTDSTADEAARERVIADIAREAWQWAISR